MDRLVGLREVIIVGTVGDEGESGQRSMSAERLLTDS